MKSSGKNLVLITRPAAEADEFAAEVKALGLHVFIEPMLGIIAKEFTMPPLEKYSGFVFTSANAVRIFGCPMAAREIPVFAVGGHTSDAVRKQGYRMVFSAEGDGADLSGLIKKKLAGAEKPVLHIRGEHTAVPLADMLRKDKIDLDSLVVYTASTGDHLTPGCREALLNGDIAAVTFFSKRTADNFIKLAEKDNVVESLKGINALCISDAVLECVRQASWAGTYSAEHPDRASMIKLLRAKCPPKP